MESSLTITRKQGLDKFYTKPTIVTDCILNFEKIYPNWNDWNLVIEPSAGSGHIYTQIPTDKKIGLDLLPEHENIIKQNYFDYNPPSNIKDKILVFGNPPFGSSCSLAIKFFNHSAKYADVIAFIIPLSFRRDSVIRRLNKKFHLISDMTLPTSSFIPNTLVKCCFQVWKKEDFNREPVFNQTTHYDFKILNHNETLTQDADFCIQQKGVYAGRLIHKLSKEFNDKKVYKTGYLYIKSNINPELLFNRMRNLDLTKTQEVQFIGSLNKSLLIQEYMNVCKNSLYWSLENL